MEDSAVITSLLAAAIRAGTSLLYATLGEIFMEKSGTLNLGLEGIMLSGALAGFAACNATGNPWLGLLAAMVAGAFFSLIHGFLTISLRAQQVVSGLALTIFAGGVCGVLGKSLVGKPGTGFDPFPLPLLGNIPFLGKVLFEQDVIVYLSYLLIPLCYVFLFKTRAGLSLRSVGENPQAAESMGINVCRVRYAYVLLGGALAGLGGAHLSLAYNHQWIDNMSAGRGWIAIALVIFSSWNPLGAALGAYLFGGIEALQFRIQAAGSDVPASLLLMLPYLFTIAVLLASSGEKKRSIAPGTLGQPYASGERL
jgi:simple sugar transport system permease protein